MVIYHRVVARGSEEAEKGIRIVANLKAPIVVLATESLGSQMQGWRLRRMKCLKYLKKLSLKLQYRIIKQSE